MYTPDTQATHMGGNTVHARTTVYSAQHWTLYFVLAQTVTLQIDIQIKVVPRNIANPQQMRDPCTSDLVYMLAQPNLRTAALAA